MGSTPTRSTGRRSVPTTTYPAGGQARVVPLVVGAQGLLGSAVLRELVRQGLEPESATVPWSDPDAAAEALATVAGELVSRGLPWRIYWCAGAGVVTSRPDQLEAEVATLQGFLTRLAALLPANRAPGAVFLASSAGGVHAGSEGSPFTEETMPWPVSDYGRSKLASEVLVRTFSAETGVPVLVARIANLYGPGQNRRKEQGLISVLCRAHVAERPSSIYVPLDTARDYVYVDDAARLAIAATDRVAGSGPGTAVTKILASQTSTPIAAILDELHRLTGRRPDVVLTMATEVQRQPRDLSLRSTVWPDLDRLVATGLRTGIALTMDSVLAEVAEVADSTWTPETPEVGVRS